MTADKLKMHIITLLFVFLGSTIHAAGEYREYVHEIERTFATQMYDEFGLRWEGTVRIMHEKVEEMGMSFVSYRRTTLEEARALELLVIDRFVQAINAHEKIQPYLDFRPFSFKRASIYISFNGALGTISDGTITRVSNISELATTSYKNHIVYKSNDPYTDKYIEELAEPYEEAVRLNALLSVNPVIHQKNEYEDEMDALFASYVQEVQEQYGVRRRAIGGKLTNGIEEIGATFRVFQSATQDEARQLLIEMTEKLLLTLNNNEKLRPYLKESPFPSGFLKIRLCFEDKDGTFPDIFMQNVALEDNAITYIQKAYQPLREGKFFREYDEIVLGPESYAEALKITQDNSQKFESKSPSLFIRFQDWLVSCVTYFYFAYIA